MHCSTRRLAGRTPASCYTTRRGMPSTYSATRAAEEPERVRSAWGFLQDVYALFNTAINGSNACFVLYDKPSNAFYLFSDTGGGGPGTGPLTPGSPASLSNTQCTLNGFASSGSGAGNTLTMVLSLTFRSGFAGLKTDFMYAADTAGQNR